MTNPKLSADSDQENYLGSNKAPTNQLENKALGQELLLCLERFIAATVSSSSHSNDAHIYNEKQDTDIYRDRHKSDEDSVDDVNTKSGMPAMILPYAREKQVLNNEVTGTASPVTVPANTDTPGNQASGTSLPGKHLNISTTSTMSTTADSEFVIIDRKMETPSPSLFGSDELPPKVLEILRWHIFNKMPIRLLTFDSDGSGIQLIERNEIFRRLLQTIRARFIQPSFQTALDKFRIATHYTIWEAEETKFFTQFVEQHGRYAILSHTWIRDTPGDVVYTQWKTRELNERGHAKIVNFCKVAARGHGLTFGWMDTVCINKDSSSELDESIRSMYKWYRLAHVCVIYLSNTVEFHQIHNDSWFTRGWTLQELLAPKDGRFYNVDWRELAADAEDIQWEIQLATTITATELHIFKAGKTDEIPISRRMKLAANRTVTREEDMSYSLMGLLGVDVPIAYGEGSERAFFRLVREILNSKKDVLDIFNHGYYPFNRLIPSTIKQFLHRSSAFDVRDYTQKSPLNDWPPLEPIVLTHLGIRITVLLIPAALRLINERTFSVHKSFGGSVLLHTSPGWRADRSVGRFIVLHPACFETGSNGDNAPQRRKIITLGVLNFGIHDDHILLPTDCLFVPLDCDLVKTGNIPANVRILPTGTRVTFKLETKNEYVSRRVPRGELEAHGMRIESIYLQ